MLVVTLATAKISSRIPGALEDVSTALAAAYLDKEKVTFPYVPIVVNTGSKLVVIDPGLGPNLYDKLTANGACLQADVAPAKPGRGRPVSRRRSRSSRAARSRLSVTVTSSGDISASTLRRSPPRLSATTG